jgi:choline dehydrogenase-like flavoprotein
MSKKDCDIIIVGAGATGLASAWRLTSSKPKLKIVVLEQGKEYDKNEYHKKNHNWEINKLKKFNTNPNSRDNIQDYPIDCSKSDIDIANFNGVGGATVLYSGHFPRFHSSDFKVKSTDKIATDWPISYKDLEKYYDLNDKIMGVCGLKGDIAYPKIKKLKRSVKLGLLGEVILEAFNKLNWHCWPSYSAINVKNNYAVNTVNHTYLPLLKKKVILKKNSRVVKIISNKTRVEGVLYLDKKKKLKRLNSKYIILACNGVGTPKVLLTSKNKYFKKGLANSSGLVGKNLMLHPLGFVEGKFKKFMNSDFGPEGCCLYSHQFYKTKKNNKFKRGYTMQVLRGSGPIETAIYLNKLKILNYGKNFINQFISNYNHTIPIAIISEDLPSKSNFVKLDKKIKDKWGQYAVKINYKIQNNTKKILKHGLNKARLVLQKAGAEKIISFAPIKHAGWHLMGTAKMGNKKNSSVVNKFGQTHDLENLYIVDSSVFPTSAAVNPISTSQALSLYITDNLLKKINENN